MWKGGYGDHESSYPTTCTGSGGADCFRARRARSASRTSSTAATPTPGSASSCPGTVCSNGSQYRFWYYDSPTSNNLLISFEGGGACWDYPTCSGQTGILGAANPNGIPTDYITQFKAKYVSPIVNGADPGIPLFRSKTNIATNGWDMVYMPYCTGDVHVGNRVVTYTDPTGANPPITFRHNGYNNTIAVAELPAHAASRASTSCW